MWLGCLLAILVRVVDVFVIVVSLPGSCVPGLAL